MSEVSTGRDAWPMSGMYSDSVIAQADRLYALLDDHGWAEHRNCGDPAEAMCGKEWAERSSVLDIAAALLRQEPAIKS